jgi:hypothetical protein
MKRVNDDNWWQSTYLCSDGDREVGQGLVVEWLPEQQGTLQAVHEHKVILHRIGFTCDNRPRHPEYVVSVMGSRGSYDLHRFPNPLLTEECY